MDFLYGTSAALFLKGIVVGMSVAAPIGPVAIMCLRFTMTCGLATGLFAGLSASIADAFYSTVALLGAHYVVGFIERHSDILNILGGLFLLFIAYRVFQTRFNGTEDRESAPSQRYLQAFVQLLVVTLASPMTTILFLGFFAAMHILGTATTGPDVAAVVAGVFVGAMLWWGLLCGAVSLVGGSWRGRLLSLVNRAAALGILLFGLYGIFQGISGGETISFSS